MTDVVLPSNDSMPAPPYNDTHPDDHHGDESWDVDPDHNSTEMADHSHSHGIERRQRMEEGEGSDEEYQEDWMYMNGLAMERFWDLPEDEVIARVSWVLSCFSASGARTCTHTVPESGGASASTPHSHSFKRMHKQPTYILLCTPRGHITPPHLGTYDTTRHAAQHASSRSKRRKQSAEIRMHFVCGHVT
jgi:hypothetical protein